MLLRFGVLPPSTEVIEDLMGKLLVSASKDSAVNATSVLRNTRRTLRSFGWQDDNTFEQWARDEIERTTEDTKREEAGYNGASFWLLLGQHVAIVHQALRQLLPAVDYDFEHSVSASLKGIDFSTSNFGFINASIPAEKREVEQPNEKSTTEVSTTVEKVLLHAKNADLFAFFCLTRALFLAGKYDSRG
ncbi:MAG: hypothetical protein SGPRY_014944 [Prymnesium sp.]